MLEMEATRAGASTFSLSRRMALRPSPRDPRYPSGTALLVGAGVVESIIVRFIGKDQKRSCWASRRVSSPKLKEKKGEI